MGGVTEWVLVPSEPTHEMLDAGVRGRIGGGMYGAYIEMTQAAPTPPAEAQVVGGGPAGELPKKWRDEAAFAGYMTGNPKIDAPTADRSAAKCECADELEAALSTQGVSGGDDPQWFADALTATGEAEPLATGSSDRQIMFTALCRIAMGHEPAQQIADDAIAASRKAALSAQPRTEPMGEAEEVVAVIHRPGWPNPDSAVYFTMEHSAYDLPPGTMLYASPRPPSAPVPEIHSYDPTERRESVTIRWEDGACLSYVLDHTRYTNNLPASAPVGVEGVPDPVAVKYPDSGLRDDAHALALWDAHGYDTGGDPLFSAEQMQAAMAAQQPAACGTCREAIRPDVLTGTTCACAQLAVVDALRLWKQGEDSGDYLTQKAATEARDSILAGQQPAAVDEVDKRDAKRYRFLRDRNGYNGVEVYIYGEAHPPGHLDAQVDAALARSQGEGDE